MSRRPIISRLLRLLRPLAPLMVVSATARVANQGLGVAIPALAAGLVVGVGTQSSVGGIAALLVVLALVKGVCRYIEQFTGHAVAFRLLAELRIDTFRKIVPLAPAGLESDRTGDLVSRVVGDIDRVEPFYAHTIAPLVSAIVVPLMAAAGLAIWVDPVIAVIFVPFPILIAVVAPWIRASRVADLSTRARDQAGQTAAVFTDTVQGAREVAVFRARDQVTDRVAGQSKATSALRGRLATIAASRSLAIDLLTGAAVVAMAAVAVFRFQSGALTLVGLAVAVVVAWVGTTPARAVEGIVADLDQALAAAGRLFDLADRSPVVDHPDDPVSGVRDGSVAFRRISLRFPNSGSAALDEIDLEIEDGATVAVVGPSGAGKSTLVELLVRFRDPDEGEVRIGGVDVADVDPTVLRRRVTLVPQRPDIFFGTLEANLRLAKVDASDEDIREALRRAGLGEWVDSLPSGLDTTIGELGETLSGGQRQRLALARAFLRDPTVLVLDEATSELDPTTERKVLNEIAAERERRTVIVVAHRLETVIDADTIVVLDRGRLVEGGKHDDLLAAGGVYAGLWQRHLDVLPA